MRVEDEEGLRKALRTPSTMAVDLHGAEVVLKEVVIVDRKIAIRNGTLKAARSKVGNGFALRVVQGGDLLLDHVQLTKSGLWVWEGSAAELRRAAGEVKRLQSGLKHAAAVADATGRQKGKWLPGSGATSRDAE